MIRKVLPTQKKHVNKIGHWFGILECQIRFLPWNMNKKFKDTSRNCATYLSINKLFIIKNDFNNILYLTA